jgi:hypothetical protein
MGDGPPVATGCRFPPRVKGEGEMGYLLVGPRAGWRKVCPVEAAKHVLERYNPVNAIGAKDAEPAFIVAAEINQAAMALAGTGERHLVNRTNALPIFILEQDNRLAGHRGGQAKIRELDNLAGDGLARSRSWGMRLRVHSLIEAEAMYQLK